MAHSSGNDYELDSKIYEMSNYLERLLLKEETDYRYDPSPVAGAYECNINRRAPPLPYIPSMPPPMSTINKYPQECEMMRASFQYQMTSVTSALATCMNTSSSTLRFPNPAPRTKYTKWTHYNREQQPDSSNININSTMVELGLTPESLTNNEVYRLFNMYQKLQFSINAEYMFEKIYEGRTLPTTMSVSVQTRHAVWSSNKLLYELRETLNNQVYVPSGYQGQLLECRQVLEDLRADIANLETYRYCTLEHRKGKFISPKERENLEPLMESLKLVIEHVGKSRMYIQVMDWTLKQSEHKAEEIAITNYEGPCQPASDDGALGPPAKGRSDMARRYIG